MSYLLDTNIVSELRKGKRCHPGVRSWFDRTSEHEVFLSVLTLGEIRKGIDLARQKDMKKAAMLELWLDQLSTSYADQLLPINAQVATLWGQLNVPDPLPTVDSLLAATALIHDLTLVSRNVKDLDRTGVRILNPFKAPAS